MCDFLNPQHISAMRLEQVVEICSDPKTGISNCIFLNREIFRLLQEKTPELFEMGRCPWVAGWIEAKEIFLHDIATAIGINPPVWHGHTALAKYYAEFFPEETIAERIMRVCDPNFPDHIGRGIFKRIDEHRQLLELLHEQTIDQAMGALWCDIEEGIETTDIFLNSIVARLALCPPIIRFNEPYPRPWPGTGHVASRYQKSEPLRPVPVAQTHTVSREGENTAPCDSATK